MNVNVIRYTLIKVQFHLRKYEKFYFVDRRRLPLKVQWCHASLKCFIYIQNECPKLETGDVCLCNRIWFAYNYNININTPEHTPPLLQHKPIQSHVTGATRARRAITVIEFKANKCTVGVDMSMPSFAREARDCKTFSYMVIR